MSQQNLAMLTRLKQINNNSNPYIFIYFIYGITFLILLLKGPIFSPDSYSYLHMEISRSPGYAICSRLFKYVFGEHFGYFLVAFHLVLGFGAIQYTLKGLNKVFKLNFWLNILLFCTLLSPYFQSIYTANNIGSEGIAFPFYLIFITSSILLIFKNDTRKIIWLAIAFILLTLTRGQFIIDTIIIAFIYGLKHLKSLKIKPVIITICILLILPIITNTLDKTYRKLIFNHYVSSPYSYVAAVTLPLFVSKKEDLKLLTGHTKNIFEFSYNRIDSLNLLSSKVDGDHYYKYMRFHRNFPPICNQNIHNRGVKYFYKNGNTIHESYIKTEQVCKNLMIPLIKANFKEYIMLYFTSIIYGFKSLPLAILIVLLASFSFIKCIKSFNLIWGYTLLTTLLVLSNAMIVAVACHSISRYLFYNNFLLVILVILLYKKINNLRK